MYPQCSHRSSCTAEELENEIAILELEVLKLERYLLTRYQQVFYHYFSASSKSKGEDTSKQMNFHRPHPLSTSTLETKVNHIREDSPKVSSGRLSLAEYLVSSPVVDASSLACKLSEDMIRCMSSIYIKLSDHEYSPSSSSSASVNGFHEVVSFSVDAEKYYSVEPMMKQFKSFVLRLEHVNPKKMDNEEKLAFWVNIHNALVMHAFLAYGRRRNYMKTSRSIMKAAYKIGGSPVRVDEIEKYILGCRPPSNELTQRLGALFLRFGKFEDVEKHPYHVIESNALVYFALCQGAYSDPPVRVYSSKNILEELEKARDEFLLANVSVHKETTILLPRLLMSYIKMSSLDLPSLLNLVPDSILKSHRQVVKRSISRIPNKYVQWLPHQPSFRYLIQKDILQK